MLPRTLAPSVTACLCIVVLLSNGTEGLGRRGSAQHFTINRWFLENPDVSATPYTECKSDAGRVTRVEVVGCDGDKCILQGGTNQTFNLNFIPSVVTTTLKADVHGIIGSIPIPFHIGEKENACKDSGLDCPLVAGQEYHYTTTIPVLKSYPKMSVKIKWELVTDKNQDVICIIIPAQIS